MSFQQFVGDSDWTPEEVTRLFKLANADMHEKLAEIAELKKEIQMLKDEKEHFEEKNFKARAMVEFKNDDLNELRERCNELEEENEKLKFENVDNV